MTAASPENSQEPLTYALTLRKHWLGILIIMALAVGGVGRYLMKQPRTYKALATVFLLPDQGVAAGPEAAFLGKDNSQVEYCKALLESATLQLQVVHDLNLKANEDFWGKISRKQRNRDTLLTRLNHLVDVHEKVGLIKISAESTNPSLSRDLANAHLDRLTQWLEEANIDRKKLLGEQVAEARRELREAEHALDDFLRSTDLPVQEGGGAAELKAQLDLSKDLVGAEASLRSVEAQVRSAGRLEAQVPLVAQAASLRAQVATLRKVVHERESRVNEIPLQSLRYIQLQRDVKIKEKVYQTLNDQYYAARSSEVERRVPYKVIDRAVRPTEPAARGLIVKLGVTAVFAFFISVFAFGLLDMFIASRRAALAARVAAVSAAGEGGGTPPDAKVPPGASPR